MSHSDLLILVLKATFFTLEEILGGAMSKSDASNSILDFLLAAEFCLNNLILIAGSREVGALHFLYFFLSVSSRMLAVSRWQGSGAGDTGLSEASSQSTWV